VFITQINQKEGLMRRLLIALAIALLPSIALAHGGHGGGGHGGGHGGGWSGGHMGGGWSGARVSSGWNSRAAVGTAHVGGWSGNRFGMRNHGSFRHGRFVHRHGRVFFVGGGPWWVGGYDSCWRWVPTAWGPRSVWVCDYF
jgi:hypothetical protein